MLPLAPAFFGCTPQQAPFPDPLEIQWKGDQVHFAADETREACFGSPAFLDSYLAKLQQIGGSDSGPVSYYVLPDADVAEICLNDQVEACAVPGRAYARDAVVIHELVHNARYAEDGFPSPGSMLFEEALADLYDPRLARFNLFDPPWGTIAPPADFEGFLESRVDGPVVAGDVAMVSFYLSALADTYGDRPVWDFVSQTGELRDGRPLRAIFEDNFPQSFEASIGAFLETTRCSEWAKTRHLLECEEDGPDIDASLETFILRPTEDGLMDCASPNVVGPRMGEMWVTRTFDVVEPIEGLSFVRAVSSEDEDEDEMLRENDPDNRVYARLTKCGGGCSNWQFDVPLGDGTFAEPLELGPGRYLVRFVRPYDDPGYAAFSLSTTPNWPFAE